MRSSFQESHTVIGVNYDPTIPQVVFDFLRQEVKKWTTDRQLTIVGSSMGGYWANLFAQQVLPRKIALINPVIDPVHRASLHLNQWIENEKRAVKFQINDDSVVGYKSLSPFKSEIQNQLVILSLDDEILDARETKAHFTSSTQTMIKNYDTGGHAIDLKNHPAGPFLQNFIRN